MTKIEIERRWLVNVTLENLPSDTQQLEIIQQYLISKETERVRQTNQGDKLTYHHTIKVSTPEGQLETENEISQEEFATLLQRVDPKRSIIVKHRYVFNYQGHKFELDRFISPVDFQILEVEIENPDEEILFPEFFESRIEVTKENGLSNYKIAAFPKAAKKLAAKLSS